MGLTEALTIVFVVLKLIGKIDWSWWLVLLPEIIGIVFYISVFMLSLYSHVSLNRAIRSFNRKDGRNG